MRVLVTGGCGYIGSALLPQLQAADDVTGISILDSFESGSPGNLLDVQIADGVSFRNGDVREYGDVESVMRGVDAVVHLAAITGAADSHDRREETFAVNREGTRNVLTAAEKLGVSNVVLASSCNVYGRATSTDIDEAVDPKPLNPYAQSKVDAEAILARHVEASDVNGTALRLSTNYGYSQGIRFNLVVNHFVFRGLTGRPPTVYGDGENWRPFIHVRDAARAFRDATCNPERWPELVYNVGSNAENYRIFEVAEVVREVIDEDLDITYLEDRRPGPSYSVNFDRLEETNFETEWTLREGVEELADRFVAART
jgi:nucleoside-diphosphate-sugar epimerase